MPIPGPVEDDLARVGGIEGLERCLPDGEMLAMRSQQFHALSDTVRLKILLLLAVHPLCVCVIREVVAVADSRLSYHLNVLKKAGLIAGAPQGNWIIYSLTAEGERFAALLTGQGRA